MTSAEENYIGYQKKSIGIWLTDSKILQLKYNVNAIQSFHISKTRQFFVVCRKIEQHHKWRKISPEILLEDSKKSWINTTWRATQKTAEATDDFLGSKIADKIAWVKKNSNQIHLIKQETEENTGMSGKATETKAKRQIYFILEEGHTIISELIQKKDI